MSLRRNHHSASSSSDRPLRTADEMLADVIREGDRRQTRRRGRVVGSAAGGVCVLFAGSVLSTVAVSGRDLNTASRFPSGTPGLASGITLPAAPSAAPAGPVPAPPVTAPAVVGRRPGPEVALVAYRGDTDFLAREKRTALARVTPYGLAYSPYERFVGVDGPPVAMSAPAGTASGTAGGGTSGSSGALSGGSTSPDAAALPSPAAGVDFSGPNNQEAGVDEPDRVKTDGRVLYAVEEGHLRIVGTTTGKPVVLADVDLTDVSTRIRPSQLLLAGNRLLAFGTSDPSSGSLPPSDGKPFVEVPQDPSVTALAVVDVSDPAHPRRLKTEQFDGSLVTARLIGGVARLVLVSLPRIPFVAPAGGTLEQAAAALAENKRRISASTARSWLPKGTTGARAFHTTNDTGLGMVTVRSFDPAGPTIGPGVSVVGGADTVYASATALFVATKEVPTVTASSQPAVGGAGRTSIHRFDIRDPLEARYDGSGDVPGVVLNQYSLSEQADALRVATTTVAGGDGVSQSQVTVLRPSKGALVEVGSVGGMGKGERIYSVRFIGYRGYVVTFRQIDPLYVLDLKDPAHPTVTGELKIPGFSAYLHPVGADRIIGIGQALNGGALGEELQVSLFDVSDPAHPAKVAGGTLPGGYSTAERDFHAFTYWEPTGLALIPTATYGADAASSFDGVVGFTVGKSALTELGRISHYEGPPTGSGSIDRSVVIRDRVFTLSRLGVMSSDLATLHTVGFVPFA